MNKNEDSNYTILNALNKLANKILLLMKQIDRIKGKTPELIANIAYIVGHLLMSIVHEPWYDEAIAWQIAKCASIKDILFEIPHYEGHPSLWHLILVPFAKSGMPYELSLSLVSLFFSAIAISLIIWKSPFPRIVRLLLPFTYFFFYQYSVISRPYCVMMLAFMLIAITTKERDDKPFRYVFCLILLCLTSAYGIVIAGGIAAVWLWNIWQYRKITEFVKSVTYDKRLQGLLILLLVAIGLMMQIMPREEAAAINQMLNNEAKNSFIIRFLYMFLALPIDVTLSSVYGQERLLRYAELNSVSLIVSCFVGIMFWGMIYIRCKTKNIKICRIVIPHLFFSLFASIIYMCTHHVGIELLLLISFLWEMLENGERKIQIKDSESIKVLHRELIESCTVIACFLGLLVSLVWNITSCIQDVFVTYAPGREEAKFISEYGLERYNIMTSWGVSYDDEGNMTGSNINYCGCASNIAPYFEHNIFFNFNQGRDDKSYNNHEVFSEDEQVKEIEVWKETVPDVLLMRPNLAQVYDSDIVNLSDFTLVYSKISNKVWKGGTTAYITEMYVRTDLLDEVGLKEVEHAKY